MSLYRADRPAPEMAAPRGSLIDVAGRTLTENQVVWQAALNAASLRKLDAAAGRRFLDALFTQLGLPADRIPNLEDRKSIHEFHLPARLGAGRRDEMRRWLAASEWGSHRPALLRFIAVPRRVYPLHAATAALVGMVDSDGYGIEGLEHALDRRLSAGESVRLTVDIALQAPTSAWLEETLRSRRGMTAASAVIMDLETGEIAAIVSVPGYDPARLAERTGPNVHLRAITQAFQAGPMLVPFLMHGAFTRELAQGATLPAPLERSTSATGEDLVAQFSGHAQVLSHLTRVGLLRAADIDFPGAMPTLVRRGGTEQELLRDLGNGAGIAPSLLQYSATLASLVSGVPARPLRLVAGGDHSIARAEEDSVSSRASRLMRDALVRRARLRAGDASADFGGLWAAYRDRVDSGSGVGRAALALFTPAESPQFLVTVILEGEPLLADPEVLELGRKVLAVIGTAKSARNTQARRGMTFASRS
jgi:hypothetical protein